MKTNYDRKTVDQLICRFHVLTRQIAVATDSDRCKTYDRQRESILCQIATITELFEPDPREKLTDDQWNQMIQFISEFQRNEQAA